MKLWELVEEELEEVVVDVVVRVVEVGKEDVVMGVIVVQQW